MAIRTIHRKVVEHKNKEPQVKNEEINLPFSALVSELNSGDVRIRCFGIQKIGYYYYSPVFAIDDTTGFADYSKYLDAGVAEQTYQNLFHTTLNLFGRSVEMAGQMNPFKAAKEGLNIKREPDKPPEQ